MPGEYIAAPLSGEVSLWFIFDMRYDSVPKTCYKLVLDMWVKILDTTGFTHQAYQRRVKIEEYNGAMNVRIQHVRFEDAGIYRCRFQVDRMIHYIYKDFQVSVSGKFFQKVFFICISSILNGDFSIEREIVPDSQTHPGLNFSVSGNLLFIALCSPGLGLIPSWETATDSPRQA